MKKKGEEVKVDLADQAAFEEVQKIVEEQEAKLKEETEGTGNLSPVSPFLALLLLCTSYFLLYVDERDGLVDWQCCTYSAMIK